MNIKYSTIRRVRITGPMSDRKEILDWIWKNSYHIKSSGPKLIGYSEIDRSKIVLVAEKEIK
jgi:hypothetical protein